MAEDLENATTTRILDAALELFNEAGYGNATVDKIARRAGVGVASLYRRWADKPALANAVYMAALDGMAPIYREPQATLPKERFMELWHRVWEYAQQNPGAFMFVESHIHSAFVDDESTARKAELGLRAATLLSGIGTDADLELVTALVTGPIVSLIRAESPQDPSDVGERVWRALST